VRRRVALRRVRDEASIMEAQSRIIRISSDPKIGSGRQFMTDAALIPCAANFDCVNWTKRPRTDGSNNAIFVGEAVETRISTSGL
jgi:hypothetical protein